MAFLLDNPNHRYKQYTYPRRGGGFTAPQIVLHTYEAPYTRSLLAAATWLTTRDTPGSYHALAGARSTTDVLQLAPWSYETWHSVPSNNWAIGISAVAEAHMWDRIPPNARENLVKSMAYAAANAAKWLEQHHGRKVEPRLLTKAQAMRKESGFVYHATMDPGRRTDPGARFPWDMFIAEFKRLMADGSSGSTTGKTPNQSEEDIMQEFLFISTDSKGRKHHYGTLAPAHYVYVEDENAYIKGRESFGRKVKWWENIANDRTVGRPREAFGEYIGPEDYRPANG